MAIVQQTLTDAGQAAKAAAEASGDPLEITTIRVGDGGGSTPTFDSSDTGLVNEVWSGAVQSVTVSPLNSSHLYVDALVPQSAGPFWIREVSLELDDGTTYSVGPHPETEKTDPSPGGSNSVFIRVIVMVSQTGTVQVGVDNTQVLATREYVDLAKESVLQAHAYTPSISRVEPRPVMGIGVSAHLGRVVTEASDDFAIATPDGVFVNPSWVVQLAGLTTGESYYLTIDAAGAVNAVPATNLPHETAGNVFGGFYYSDYNDFDLTCCWDVGWRPNCADPRNMVRRNGTWWDAFWLGDDWETTNRSSLPGKTIDLAAWSFVPFIAATLGKRIPTIQDIRSMIKWEDFDPNTFEVDYAEVPSPIPTATAVEDTWKNLHQMAAYDLILNEAVWVEGDSAVRRLMHPKEPVGAEIAYLSGDGIAVRLVADHFTDWR